MKNYYGSIDIGGTKIITGICDENGRIYSWEKFPTLELPVKDTMHRMIDSLRSQSNKLSLDLSNLKGIGIVCAGPVDYVNGIVENPYTLPGWEHFPLTKYLHKLSGLPIKLENDVNGALLGEVKIKNLEQSRVLMIAFGTGIGVAFKDKNGLYRTSDSFHPELGHIVISDDNDKCYCGHRGCFENLCSGTALHRRSKNLGFDNFNELYDAYIGKDKKAIKFINKYKIELQNAIWNFRIIFKPQYIILGGGMMQKFFHLAESALLDETIEEAEDFLVPYTLLQADTINNTALIGGVELFHL